MAQGAAHTAGWVAGPPAALVVALMAPLAALTAIALAAALAVTLVVAVKVIEAVAAAAEVTRGMEAKAAMRAVLLVLVTAGGLRAERIGGRVEAHGVEEEWMVRVAPLALVELLVEVGSSGLVALAVVGAPVVREVAREVGSDRHR